MGCALTAMGTEAVGTDGGGGGDEESSKDRALDRGRFCILQDLSWVCAETQTESQGVGLSSGVSKEVGAALGT